MTIPVKFALISILLVGVFGCSAESAEKAAADARVDAADANARVIAADARVRAARPAAVIPSGTVLKVSLIDALDSDTSAAGDRFLASLAEPVVINGVTLLQKGTQVRGRVVDVEGAGRVKGRASIHLSLTEVMKGERMVAITTHTLAATADSTQKRDVGIIAGGAGVGAVIGAIADGKKGAGIGAITGGGAGTGIVLATKGKEVHYGPETRLNFTLANSIQM